MSLDIAAVLTILAAAAVLFVTDRVRVDVVALMVLLGVSLGGLISPAEALSGFSNPAVVVVWTVFILGGALSRTGVAGRLGRFVLRFAGAGEAGLVAAIMITGGCLSAFMSNVGVTALLLPVVMDISRRTGVPASKLLIPVAFSSLLGGLLTLIGTPPNILVSAALEHQGLEPFAIFDFVPVGLVVLLAGIAYMTWAGRRILPRRASPRTADGGDLTKTYGLSDRLSVLHLAPGSALAGRTLAESRLGAALGVHVLAVYREGHTRHAPAPDFVLRDGDRLLVGGQLDRLAEFRNEDPLLFDEESPTVVRLMCDELEFHEVGLAPNSSLVGKTLRQVSFRQRFALSVLAVLRGGSLRRLRIADLILEEGDVLLVQGRDEQMEAFHGNPDFDVRQTGRDVYPCEERLLITHVPEGSSLIGRTAREARLGEAFGLIVLGIARDGHPGLLDGSNMAFAAGDVVLVEGRPDDLLTVKGLQDLEIDRRSLAELELESDRVSLAEVVLSPRTTLAGRTLRELHFREKYGLSVLAVLRMGTLIQTHLRTLPLQMGDALLLYGPRDKLRLFGSEPDFIVLSEEIGEPPRLHKAPWALAVMAATIVPAIFGWVPISLSFVLGATLMVLTGCLTMDEAYRYIEWRAVFVIAGMLPLSVALQKTGAVDFLTSGMVTAVGGLGPHGIVAALFLATVLGAQLMPPPAVAVLMAPIALHTAASLALSPQALTMTVAVAASTSFMSPVAHPSNILVMGPGGYRFVDYFKVGFPLTLICLAIVLGVLPLFWPLS